MTGLPPPPPPPRDPGDVDEWYRRVSSSDRSGPSESVRQAVLDHATKLAATHASKPSRRWNWAGWRGPAVASTLAAALAAVMLLPRVLSPPVDEAVAPSIEASSAHRAPLARSAAPPATPAVAPALQPSPRSRAPARPEASLSYTEAADRAQSAAGFAKNAGPPVAEPESRDARQSITAAVQTQALRPNPQASQETAAALRRAAEIGDLAALETLLQKNVDLDSPDSSGRTALMLATVHGQADAAVALLDHGASPNAADARGTTPLEAAQAGNHPDIAAALKRYGAR
jgi:Ankyrin repeats (3 copies)